MTCGTFSHNQQQQECAQMWKFWIVMIYKLDPSAMNGCYPTIYGWLPDDAVYKGQGGTVFINETDARRAYETTQINDEVCRV